MELWRTGTKTDSYSPIWRFRLVSVALVTLLNSFKTVLVQNYVYELCEWHIYWNELANQQGGDSESLQRRPSVQHERMKKQKRCQRSQT